MDAAQKLICQALSQHFCEEEICNHLVNFQSVLYTQKIEASYFPVDSSHIQILHNGTNHWVLASCSQDEIKICDSMNKGKVSDAVYRSIISLWPYWENESGKSEFSFLSVQRQNDTNSCGLFAIAFAAELVFGFSPENVEFNTSLMRQHLIKCLEEKKLESFPKENENSNMRNLDAKNGESNLIEYLEMNKLKCFPKQSAPKQNSKEGNFNQKDESKEDDYYDNEGLEEMLSTFEKNVENTLKDSQNGAIKGASKNLWNMDLNIQTQIKKFQLKSQERELDIISVCSSRINMERVAKNNFHSQLGLKPNNARQKTLDPSRRLHYSYNEKYLIPQAPTEAKAKVAHSKVLKNVKRYRRDDACKINEDA